MRLLSAQACALDIEGGMAQKVKWCKFFFTFAGCDRGDACGFMHSKADRGAPTSPRRQIPYCAQWNGGRCKHGDQCKYRHEVDALARHRHNKAVVDEFQQQQENDKAKASSSQEGAKADASSSREVDQA